MNERIKELALQAGYLPDGFGIGHWDMIECKNLVKLIVKECVAICNDTNDASYLNGVIAGRKIKQHFGVEE